MITAIATRFGIIFSGNLPLQSKCKIYTDLTFNEKFRHYNLLADGSILVPKFYGFDFMKSSLGSARAEFSQNYNPPVTLLASSLKFEGELLPHQLKPYEMTIGALRTLGGARVALNTGGGKTLLAIKAICDLGVKTLFMANNRQILKQFRTSAIKHIPGARIADLGDKEDADIYLITTQYLMKNLGKVDVSWVNFLVIDECHHVSSEGFADVLKMFGGVPWILGLSATPERKDSNEAKLAGYYMGPVVYYSEQLRVDNPLGFEALIEPKAEYPKKLIVQQIKLYIEGVEYPNILENEKTRRAESIKNLNLLTAMPERARFISDILIQWLYNYYLAAKWKPDERQILFVVSSHAGVEQISRYLEKESIPYKIEVGLGSANRYKKNKQSDINDAIFIVGTMQNVGTGWSRETVNIMVMPLGITEAIKQIEGRPKRSQNPKYNPIIIDVVDQHNYYFIKQAITREKFYKKNNHHINPIKIRLNYAQLDEGKNILVEKSIWEI